MTYPTSGIFVPGISDANEDTKQEVYFDENGEFSFGSSEELVFDETIDETPNGERFGYGSVEPVVETVDPSGAASLHGTGPSTIAGEAPITGPLPEPEDLPDPTLFEVAWGL